MARDHLLAWLGPSIAVSIILRFPDIKPILGAQTAKNTDFLVQGSHCIENLTASRYNVYNGGARTGSTRRTLLHNYTLGGLPKSPKQGNAQLHH